jgi:uncharacterized protein (UPF0335 family)
MHIDKELVKKFVLQLEAIEEQKGIITEELKLTLQEAKTEGLDVKTLKKVVKDRIQGKMKEDIVEEIDLYSAYLEASLG